MWRRRCRIDPNSSGWMIPASLVTEDETPPVGAGETPAFPPL
jgi:hypothetical protein